MAENTALNSTAVATAPVPTNWMYGIPSTCETSLPNPKPNATSMITGSTTAANVRVRQ
jgi:hypothetical protein